MARHDLSTAAGLFGRGAEGLADVLFGGSRKKAFQKGRKEETGVQSQLFKAALNQAKAQIEQQQLAERAEGVLRARDAGLGEVPSGGETDILTEILLGNDATKRAALLKVPGVNSANFALGEKRGREGELASLKTSILEEQRALELEKLQAEVGRTTAQEFNAAQSARATKEKLPFQLDKLAAEIDFKEASTVTKEEGTQPTGQSKITLFKLAREMVNPAGFTGKRELTGNDEIKAIQEFGQQFGVDFTSIGNDFDGNDLGALAEKAGQAPDIFKVDQAVEGFAIGDEAIRSEDGRMFNLSDIDRTIEGASITDLEKTLVPLIKIYRSNGLPEEIIKAIEKRIKKKIALLKSKK